MFGQKLVTYDNFNNGHCMSWLRQREFGLWLLFARMTRVLMGIPMDYQLLVLDLIIVYRREKIRRPTWWVKGCKCKIYHMWCRVNRSCSVIGSHTFRSGSPTLALAAMFLVDLGMSFVLRLWYSTKLSFGDQLHWPMPLGKKDNKSTFYFRLLSYVFFNAFISYLGMHHTKF